MVISDCDNEEKKRDLEKKVLAGKSKTTPHP